MTTKAGEGRKEHGSVKQTENVTYDRLRSLGYSRDDARDNARRISEQVHRDHSKR